MDLSTSLERNTGIRNEIIRQPCRIQLAVHLILTSILMLLFGCYSFVNILPASLKLNSTLKWDEENAQTAVGIFQGSGIIFTFIFAILTDSKIGRVKMIQFGFPLAFIGFTLMTIFTSLKSTSNHFNQTDNFLFEEIYAVPILLSLIIIAIAGAAVIPNLLVFGADQVRESVTTSRYFDKLMIIIGLTNILAKLFEQYAGDLDSYLTIYIIATSLIFLAGLLFFIGLPLHCYAHIDPYDSVIMNFIPLIVNAFQSRHRYRSNQPMPSRDNIPIVCNGNFGELDAENDEPSTFFDHARRVFYGRFDDRIVNDVKLFRNNLIVFLIVTPYWLISMIFHVICSKQTYQMSSGISADTIIYLSEQLMTIIGVVVLYLFVYGYLENRNRSLTTTHKLMLSICFALAAACISSLIEIWRQSQCPCHQLLNEMISIQNTTCTNRTSSDLSAFVQLVPKIAISLRQLFGLLATYEFAYINAPRSAQSLFMSFCLFPIILPVVITNIKAINLDFDCSTDHDYNWLNVIYFVIFIPANLLIVFIFRFCQNYFEIFN